MELKKLCDDWTSLYSDILDGGVRGGIFQKKMTIDSRKLYWRRFKVMRVVKLEQHIFSW